MNLSVSEDYSHLDTNQFKIYYKSKADISDFFLNVPDNIDLEVIGLENFVKSISLKCSFFSVVIFSKKNNNIYLVSDVIRSFPLYYCIDKDGVTVKSKLIETDLQSINEYVDEYRALGLVSGAHTLAANYNSVSAGEYHRFDGKNLEIKEWESYTPTANREKKNLETEQAHKLIKEGLARSIDKLIDYAAGRQIVLPLSGGYDSRLIALLLKNKGYPDVVCFTYGKANNWEANISKDIASRLGYKWFFVEYTNKLWSELRADNSFLEYLAVAGSYLSTPHPQDWPAIKDLLKNKNISADAVVVPGHSTDFIAGSHIDPRFMEKNNFSLDDLSTYMTERFVVNDSLPLSHCQRYFAGYLTAAFEKRTVLSRDEAIDFFEKWDLKERQSKFIVNSLKVYEYHKLDCFIPMWDFELVKLFQSFPTRLRYKTLLYLEAVSYFQEHIIGNTRKSDPPFSFKLKISLYKLAKVVGIYKALISLRSRLLGVLPRNYVISDNMGWYGLFDKESDNGKQKKFYALMGDFYLKVIGIGKR